MTSPSENNVPFSPELKSMAVDDPAPALPIMSRRHDKPRAYKSTKPPKRKICLGAAAGSKKTQRKRRGPAASAKSARSDKDGNFVPTVSTIRGDGTTTNDDTKSKEGPEVTRACDETAGDDMRPPDDLDNTGLDGITSFSDFNVFIDGLVADDHELFPDRLRKAYFELCCERNTLLNSNLLRKTSPALVVGVIVQTIIISEGVKAFSFASPTSREDLVAWSKTIEFLELMGMDLAFLRQSVEDFLSILSAQSHRCKSRGTQRPKAQRAAQR